MGRFEGTYTALVTPFAADGSVDEGAFREIVEAQVAGGVDGIVPCGTTGESATLSHDEHLRVIALAVEAAAGRVKVLAGSGSNSTRETIEMTREAKGAGADGSLLISPYYNKPGQTGLLAHYRAVADAVDFPLVLYNVPSRTAQAIEVETVVRLAGHPNVVGIKDAGGDAGRVTEILRGCSIDVLSGDDGLTLPMMLFGAVGVISVASNVEPAGVSRMVGAARKGDWETARREHLRLDPLFRGLFLETNPVPAKTALALLGRGNGTLRLPLVPMGEGARDRLRGILEGLGLLTGDREKASTNA